MAPRTVTRHLLCCLLSAWGALSCASPYQAPEIPAGEDPLRWANEVEALVQRPPREARPMVFLGSSSIRRWSTLAEDMAPLPVLNRGFGGSRIYDSVHWFEPLVAVHDPRVVVVFAGTNDLAGKSPRAPGWIAARFDELVEACQHHCPGVPLVYIAISPTPSRAEHLEAVLETNRLIAERCARDPLLEFVDTASALLDAQGCPDPRWFVEDRLHLNAEGYRHWTRVLKPFLERLAASERG